MKKIKHGILLVGVAISLAMSCSKQIPNNSVDPPLVLLQSWISDGPWQLVSATRYNSSGTINNYRGNIMDTLQFGYTSDSNQNVVRTAAGMYIKGVYTVCRYQVPPDSTIIFGQSCRLGYNDTIKLSSFSENLIVFKVKFDSADIHCWEVDSLKKMYFWH
jgi:hypothetical protein